MNKKQSSLMASMRKKLLAAVAMLLVACIMTVSSTYAWFTLSTAPEVKGISTNIGANGNLEMALATYATLYGDGIVGSGTSDSIDATGSSWLTTNTTWGNLVDLSTGYGLDKISLYPTRLNANGNTLSLLNPLQFPSYGSDGRITELKNTTMLGKLSESGTGFVGLSTPDHAGISAIGSASSMSERAFAVRNAKAAVESNRIAAINAAKEAIRNYAGDLAGLAIKNMDADASAVVTAAEKEVLANLIAKLQQSNNYISESMKSALLVVLAAWTPVDTEDGKTGLSDDAWKIAAAAAEGKDIAQYITFLGGDDTSFVTLPSDVTQYVTNYQDINTILSNALAALGEKDENDAWVDGTWSEVETAVGGLLNASGILICGHTISDIQASKDNPDHPSGAFQAVTTAVMNGGLVFQFSKTSGIFADIAEFTGEYSSSIKFAAGTVVEGIDLGAMDAKPVTVQSPSVNPTTGDLGLVAAFVAPLDADDSGDATEAKPLTDTYGYVIDLLFRTNATDSYLQLQTDGVNRYMDGASDATAGNGSNFTFTLTEEYTEEKIAALAEGIRVVFYNTHTVGSNSATILGVAILDVANATVTGDAYKLNLKLVNYTIGTDGKITGLTDREDVNTTPHDERIALCALQANTKTAVSALVYLDGDVIDNADAGLSANLMGKLNLQFSSSVELKPMANNDLMNRVEDQD